MATVAGDPQYERWRPLSSLRRSATIAAAAIVAGGTAYAANQQKKAAAKAAKAASQPSTQTVDQTTTQTGWGNVQGDLDFAREEARRLYDQGPVLRGGGGKGGGAKNQGAVITQNGVQGVMSKNGKFQPLGAAATAKNAGGKGGPSKPSMDAQNRQIAQQIIDTGKAGNPNLGAADDYLGSVYEKGGLAGNEVYQDLNNRYANASLDDGNELLRNWLAGGSGSGSGAGGGGKSGGGNVRYGYAKNSSGGMDPAPGQSGITDQTKGPGLFNDWAKKALDGSIIDPNDPNLAAYLEMIQRKGQEDLDAQLQDVGDEFEAGGMYGGSGLALERALARSRGNEGISDARTKAMMDFRGQGLDYMGNAAGLVNNRDIAGSQLQSEERMNRENARASASAAGAAADAQLQIANRSLDLEGIQAFLQNNQFGLHELGGIGNAVSADRMAGIDAMKGLDDIRYGGLDKAYGVSKDVAARDAAQRARAEQRRYENATAPSRHLDEYLNRLGFFNNVGGTTSTKGTTTGVNPGAAAAYQYGGPDPWAAGLAAGAGTYFQGYGTGGGVPSKKGSKDPEPWLGKGGG